jgi:hypothetical protein
MNVSRKRPFVCGGISPEVHAVSTKLLLQNSEGFPGMGDVVSPVPEMRNSQTLLVQSAN